MPRGPMGLECTWSQLAAFMADDELAEAQFHRRQAEQTNKAAQFLAGIEELVRLHGVPRDEVDIIATAELSGLGGEVLLYFGGDLFYLRSDDVGDLEVVESGTIDPDTQDIEQEVVTAIPVEELFVNLTTGKISRKSESYLDGFFIGLIDRILEGTDPESIFSIGPEDLGELKGSDIWPDLRDNIGLLAIKSSLFSDCDTAEQKQAQPQDL